MKCVTRSNFVLIISIFSTTQISASELELKATQHATQLCNILKTGTKQGYIGEAGISQLEHALQAAQQMIDFRGLKVEHLAIHSDAELVWAALFHDIGHLAPYEGSETMEDYGIAHHEQHGARRVLENGLSQRVANLIAAHTTAKRYLAKTDPNYYESLSDASKATMKYQGGAMGDQEAADFTAAPDFAEKILVRRCDDAAKVPGKATVTLQQLYPQLVLYLVDRLAKCQEAQSE